jgi:hypothetical protein
MAETNVRNPGPDFLSQTAPALVAKLARARALAAGLTITTLKDGRLVQEKMVDGLVVQLFCEDREADAEF